MTNNPISRYLDEIIDYGGIPTTRGEAILDMQSMGIDQPCIDRWLQGQEFTARLRQRRDPITVKLLLTKKAPRHRQRTSKSPANHQQITSKSPANHQQMDHKGTTNHHKATTKPPQSHHKNRHISHGQCQSRTHKTRRNTHKTLKEALRRPPILYVR